MAALGKNAFPVLDQRLGTRFWIFPQPPFIPGYGYLELGYSEIGGVLRPYALNFDTIAHEIGHFILLSELGLPLGISGDHDFFPYSEAFADLISLISLLTFDSAVDRLLRRTNG